MCFYVLRLNSPSVHNNTYEFTEGGLMHCTDTVQVLNINHPDAYNKCIVFVLRGMSWRITFICVSSKAPQIAVAYSPHALYLWYMLAMCECSMRVYMMRRPSLALVKTQIHGVKRGVSQGSNFYPLKEGAGSATAWLFVLESDWSLDRWRVITELIYWHRCWSGVSFNMHFSDSTMTWTLRREEHENLAFLVIKR